MEMAKLGRFKTQLLNERCTYGSCKEPPLAGDYLCLVHGIIERRRQRRAQAARRKVDRRNGRRITLVTTPPTTTVTTAPPALCEICDERPATITEKVAGHPFLICEPCRAEEGDAPAEMTPRDRVLTALGRFGAEGCEIAQLCDALGEDGEAGLQKVSALLKRTIVAGLVTFSGRKMDRMYRLVGKL